MNDLIGWWWRDMNANADLGHNEEFMHLNPDTFKSKQKGQAIIAFWYCESASVQMRHGDEFTP